MDAVSFYMFRWFLCFFTVSGFQLIKSETMYVSIGSNVTITCPSKNVISWQYQDSKEVLATCEHGQSSINPNISNRFNVTSDCQLHIQNFTSDDLRIYFCTATQQGKDKIRVKLRNLHIVGTNGSGVMQGIEGETITLICNVTGFLPDDTLFWIKDNEVVASNRTSSLNYTLEARRSDNGKEFKCLANNSKDTRQLFARVQLNLLLKPKVTVSVTVMSSDRKTGNSLTVRQGQHVELQCQKKHNASGDVDIFSWLFNGQNLQTNSTQVVFNKISPTSTGKYTCLGKNIAGVDNQTMSIIVTYPPVLWPNNVTFNGMNRPRTLKCNVSGEPNTYNFTWSHYINSKHLVRTFDSGSDGVLILPEGETNDLVFEDSGSYLCNVSNGVPDENRNLWQAGKIKVMVEGKPVLAKPQKSVFVGRFNWTSSINLFVLSSSNVTQAEWKDENGNSLKHNFCSSTVNKALIYGKLLEVSGFTCVYQIPNTREEDFQNYTVDIENKNGRQTFDISLVSSGAPEIPDIHCVYQRHHYIVLEWKPKFNGGAPQGFIAQYRKKEDEIWESIWIQSNETNDFLHISNPKLNTEYVFRMMAFNRLGNSSFTEEHTVFFDGETKNVGIQFKFFFLCIAVLLPVGFIILLRRYTQARKTVGNNSQRRNSNPAQGVAIGNDIELSANRDDVYSSIDSRRQILDQQLVNYKIAGKGKEGNKSDYENVNQRQHRNRKHDSKKLNYIEIVFDTVTNKRKFLIHGSDNRTPYADIDFTAKADPMISSDENEDSLSLNENNENDFVSLEDVQQWNINSE